MKKLSLEEIFYLNLSDVYFLFKIKDNNKEFETLINSYGYNLMLEEALKITNLDPENYFSPSPNKELNEALKIQINKLIDLFFQDYIIEAEINNKKAFLDPETFIHYAFYPEYQIKIQKLHKKRIIKQSNENSYSSQKTSVLNEDINLFKTLGEELYGKNWKTTLTKKTGLSLKSRSIHKMATKERPISLKIEKKLLEEIKIKELSLWDLRNLINQLWIKQDNQITR